MDRITWDPEKDRLNRAKHGIGFTEARLVLFNELTREWPDADHSTLEPRALNLGVTPSGDVLLIVTAATIDGSIRIISARRATKRERHAYEAR